jgi:hypothetical protein
MKFNSQICTTKEQSERLLALGLKAETADMRHILFEGDLEPCIRTMPWNSICIPCQNNFPAWSLHRLLCLLPTEYIADIDFQRIMQDFVFGSQDMYDEMVSCIETLIEAEYFYKEYLEE